MAIKMHRKPLLFGTLGSPGSGKSYFSERFCREFNFIHLRSDELRDRIIKNPQYIASEHAIVFGAMDFMAEKFLRAGTSVIYDANSNLKNHRNKLREIAKKTKARFLLIWFKTPIEVAIKRAAKRSFHPVDELVVSNLHKEIEDPIKERHIVLNGLDSYKKQSQHVLKFIKNEITF